MTDAALTPSPVASTWLKSKAFENLRKDFVAGATVAAISLPQSMAYALIAGVDPRFGLYTAIVFTAVAGIFGSSNHLINGPTGAVSLVTFSALAFIDPDARLDAYEAMFLLATMVGVVQIFIAVTRLGDVTRYISESVVTGFIAGAAFLTIIGQVANALGVKAQGTGHQHVLYRLYLTLTQAGAFNYKAIAISVSAILFAVYGRKLIRRLGLPQIEMLIAVIGLSFIAYLLGWSQSVPGGKPAVPLIEAIPAALPGFHIPSNSVGVADRFVVLGRVDRRFLVCLKRSQSPRLSPIVHASNSTITDSASRRGSAISSAASSAACPARDRCRALQSIIQPALCRASRAFSRRRWSPLWFCCLGRLPRSYPNPCWRASLSSRRRG